MCDEQTFNFADLNLDFLELTPPRPTRGAAQTTRILTPLKTATLLLDTKPKRAVRNSEHKRLSERIANTDALVQKVRQLENKRIQLQEQLQDLNQSAQEIRKLYEDEKCQRIELQAKTNQLQSKCDYLDTELAHKTLQHDQQHAQWDKMKRPVEYGKLAVQFLKLSQKFDEEHKLHWQDQAFVEEIGKYCEEMKLRVPPVKSPRKRIRNTKHEKAVQCDLWERPVESVEPTPVVASKETRSLGTQCEHIRTRTQATQYISTTTTRSTSTVCTIKMCHVSTSCPEKSPLPSVHDMLQELCKWDKITPVTPIPPPPPPPASPLLPKKASLRTIGTCTFLCNIQRHIDFMPPASIKHSTSRPPSRLQYDGERIKHEVGTPTQPTVNITYPSSPSLNSFAFSAFSHLQTSTFEELWQVFGHMLLGLLQNHNTSILSTAHGNQLNNTINQEEFQNWMRCLYDSMQQRTHAQSTFGTAEFEEPTVEILHPHARSATKEQMAAAYPQDEHTADRQQNTSVNSITSNADCIPEENMSFIRLPPRNELSEISEIKMSLSSTIQASESVSIQPNERSESTLADKLLNLFPSEEQSKKNRFAIKNLLKCDSKKRKASKTRKPKEKISHAFKMETNSDMPKEETLETAVDFLTKLGSFKNQASQPPTNPIFTEPSANKKHKSQLSAVSTQTSCKEDEVGAQYKDEEASQTIGALSDQTSKHNQMEYNLFGSDTELEDVEESCKLFIVDNENTQEYQTKEELGKNRNIETCTGYRAELRNSSCASFNAELDSELGKKVKYPEDSKIALNSEEAEYLLDIKPVTYSYVNLNAKDAAIDTAKTEIPAGTTADKHLIIDEVNTENIAVNLEAAAITADVASTNQAHEENEFSVIVISSDTSTDIEVGTQMFSTEIENGKGDRSEKKLRSHGEENKTENDTHDDSAEDDASISALIDSQLMHDILSESRTQCLIEEISKAEANLDFDIKTELDFSLPVESTSSVTVTKTDNSSSILPPAMSNAKSPNKRGLKRKIKLNYETNQHACKRSERLRAKQLVLERVTTDSIASPVELGKYIRVQQQATVNSRSKPKLPPAATERNLQRHTKANRLDNVSMMDSAITATGDTAYNEMSLQINLGYFQERKTLSAAKLTTKSCDKALLEKTQLNVTPEFNECQAQRIAVAPCNALEEHSQNKANHVLQHTFCEQPAIAARETAPITDAFYDASPASPPPLPADIESMPETPREIPLKQQLAVTDHKRNSLLDRLISCYSADQYKPLQEKLSEKQLAQRLALDTQLHAEIKSYINGAVDPNDLESAALVVQSLLQITDSHEFIACAIVKQLQVVPRPEVELSCTIDAVPSKYLSAPHRRTSLVVHHLQQQQRPEFVCQLMGEIENTLFNCQNAEKLSLNAALNLTQLYLLLTSNHLPRTQANPARLFVAKCLYYHQLKAIPMIYEVLSCFPSTLPHREDRNYDRSDALITVIQHILMCTSYDMDNRDLRSKELLSKLRFEYHFEPFKPDKFEVMKNLVDKLRAGKLTNIHYAYAVFCKRQHAAKVTADVLQPLLSLANEYYPLVLQSSDYDERVAALLACISTVIKPFPLDTDVEPYLCIFSRFLHAVQRPCIQEAAVLAILRLQRFGYVNCYKVLLQFKPAYEMHHQTKAILKTFIHRKPLNFWKTLRTQTFVAGH